MELDLYGWFPKENEETLEKLIKEHDIKTVLEIGCFLGKSTKFFVEQGCTVISIDTFEGASDLNRCEEVIKRLPNLYKQFKFNLKELGIENKVQIFKGTSEQAFDYFYNGKPFAVDLIFVDGSHEYEDVKKDIEMWSRIKSKILCGDDYTDAHEDVKKAVDELLPNSNKNQRLWYQIKN